jgi:Lectin C-type domain
MSRSFVIAALILASASSSAFAQLDPVALRYNPANEHTYALSPVGMDWLTAQAWSRTLGGYLVAINDAAEQAFIQAQFGGPGAPPYWIGLSDHETEGLWKWDSGEPVVYANFCANEPNNFGGVEHFCEIFPTYTGGAPCWNDNQSPYTGTGIAPTQAIIELAFGHRVDFDGPVTPCVTPFPFPLGTPGDPEGVSWNGASLGLVEKPVVTAIAEEGFPVSGTQYLRVPAWGLRSVPFGGPLLRPVPPGINEIRVAMPPGTKGVSLAWEFLRKHSVGSSVNDGMDISVVDASGALIANVAYADCSSPFPPSGWLTHMICGIAAGGVMTGQNGPEFASRALPLLPHPAYLSIVVWNDQTNFGQSVAHVDAIQFWGSSQLDLEITAPTGPGSIRLQNVGGGAGNTYWTAVTLVPGAFPSGWLFGLDISPADLLGEVMFGPPFSGTLSASGTSSFTVPGGVPSGLPVYAISLQFGSAFGDFLGASLPVFFMTP